MAIVKPLKTNPDNIDLDTLELFEQVQEELNNTSRAESGRLQAPDRGHVRGWTIADAGKITRAEMPQVDRSAGQGV
jgi:hypothetical protein